MMTIRVGFIKGKHHANSGNDAISQIWTCSSYEVNKEGTLIVKGSGNNEVLVVYSNRVWASVETLRDPK